MKQEKVLSEEFLAMIPDEINTDLFRKEDYLRGAIDLYNFLHNTFEDDLK